MNRGPNTKKHILTIILSCLVLLTIGLVVWIVVVKLNQPEPLPDLPNDQLVSKMRDDIRTLDIDESMDYINYKLTQYQDEEIQYELKMMKVNVYLNYDQPEEALTASNDIKEDNLTPQQKMRLYHVLNQIYTKTKDEEKATEYLEKFQAMYKIIYGESKTE